jgi:magnesium transporter
VIQVMGHFSKGKLVADDPGAALPAGVVPGTPHLIPELHALAEQAVQIPGSFVWIALFEPTKPELAVVADLYGLPPLQVDDAANERQRPKIELHHDRAFVVFKLLEYVEASSDIETGQMSVFVGPTYVITVRFGSSGDMGWVLDRLAGTTELNEHGSVSVFHAVLDAAVDDYLGVVDEISKDIEEIEESVFSPDRTDDSAAIYELKRENLEIRRAVNPLLQGATLLARDEPTRMPRALRPYFRDIADHVLRAGDAIDANDSLLLTILQASTARLDLQQNADMRRISAWVALAAVPTMIAGIYGMNFDDMPELHMWWGYPTVLGFMASVCGFMYYQFKKSKWL